MYIFKQIYLDTFILYTLYLDNFLSIDGNYFYLHRIFGNYYRFICKFIYP
jgi:hypothetical protein